MQMGFTRYNQLEQGEHKSKMKSVLRYSIYRNFLSLRKNFDVLNSYVSDNFETKDILSIINNKINDLNYNPNPIELKKDICTELYKHGKYYLD